jgi:hypothetical protein
LVLPLPINPLQRHAARRIRIRARFKHSDRRMAFEAPLMLGQVA